MVGWAKAGSKQKKILVPTKRKQSPFSILHNGMKLGRKIILKRVLEELEPQGRCHQRQEFPLPGRNWKGWQKMSPKGTSPAVWPQLSLSP